MEGWMDGRMDGDGWMDEPIDQFQGQWLEKLHLPLPANLCIQKRHVEVNIKF